MKKIIKIISIAMVALFLSLALAPSSNAVIPHKIKISYTDEKGESFYKVVQVDEDDLMKFSKSWDSWEGLVRDIRFDNELEFAEIKAIKKEAKTLLEELKALTYDFETNTYEFPSVNIEQLIYDNVHLMGKGNRIFSIGRGNAWIPFNRQGETFIGMRFMPIIIKHDIGFTRSRSFSLLPLSRVTYERMFNHRLVAWGFTGLYVDFGKRYFDDTKGPIIIIGRPSLLNLGSDII